MCRPPLLASCLDLRNYAALLQFFWSWYILLCSSGGDCCVESRRRQISCLYCVLGRTVVSTSCTALGSQLLNQRLLCTNNKGVLSGSNSNERFVGIPPQTPASTEYLPAACLQVIPARCKDSAPRLPPSTVRPSWAQLRSPQPLHNLGQRSCCFVGPVYEPFHLTPPSFPPFFLSPAGPHSRGTERNGTVARCIIGCVFFPTGVHPGAET